MILANNFYNEIAATAMVTFETAVTIRETKHTAQILSDNEHTLVIVFRGDVAKNKTKTVVAAKFEEYGDANRFLSTLLQAAARGDSIKPLTIRKTHRDREYYNTFPSVYEATRHYGYTLQAGASWAHDRGCKKVNQNPTTAKALIAALDNAVHNTQGSCYNPDSYELV